MRFDTIAIHGGIKVDRDTLSRAVPLYRTTSYLFKSSEHAVKLFNLEEEGYIYTRIGNPTQEVLEKRVAMLEGGKGALALASGTSAIFYTVINICESGDEIISSDKLYGGTFTMFNDILPQFGIKVRFVNPNNPNEIKTQINKKTKMIYTETIGNPSLDVSDLELLSEIAKEYNIPFVVDSTFTTPYLIRPIEYGANIVVHSLTKWLGGHGTAIGGIVIDAGNFNWQDSKFRLYTEPDESYHGIRFAYDLGENNDIAFIMRMRLVPLRNLGACISPDNAWIILQGIETLHLRMERHCENAYKVAKFLEEHPKIEWVRYPGLASHPTHKIAKKYLKKGFGGVVVFGIKGGEEAGRKFIENLKLISHLANVGDAKSLAIHPASTTHSQLSEEAQLKAGITPNLIRLSVGIEHIDDILEDIKQALEKV
jgi:O-acetylhomoserine (thiol)-lyase